MLQGKFRNGSIIVRETSGSPLVCSKSVNVRRAGDTKIIRKEKWRDSIHRMILVYLNHYLGWSSGPPVELTVASCLLSRLSEDSVQRIALPGLQAEAYLWSLKVQWLFRPASTKIDGRVLRILYLATVDLP